MTGDHTTITDLLLVAAVTIPACVVFVAVSMRRETVKRRAGK